VRRSNPIEPATSSLLERGDCFGGGKRRLAHRPRRRSPWGEGERHESGGFSDRFLGFLFDLGRGGGLMSCPRRLGEYADLFQ
jgi:hypothetical protein